MPSFSIPKFRGFIKTNLGLHSTLPFFKRSGIHVYTDILITFVRQQNFKNFIRLTLVVGRTASQVFQSNRNCEEL